VAPGKAFTLDPRLGDLLGSGGRLLDLLLRLAVEAANVDLLDLLDGRDAGAERVEVVGVAELDRLGVGVGLLEFTPGVVDGELEADALREPPHELPVGLVVLEHEVERRAAAGGVDADPAVVADAPDDVRDRLVEERALLARAHHPVRAVIGAHDHRDAAGLEVGLDRDDLALEQLLGGGLLDRAELDHERLPDLEGGVVELLERVALGLARIADRDGAHVGQPQPVRDLDVADEVHVLRIELLTVDLDLEERGVLFRRHQVSIVGMVSWEPRRSANGLSMPLASAILRQRVASP
jgi:hypothetical protein